MLRLDLSRRREKKEKREEGEGEKRKAYQPEQRGKEKKIFRGRFPIDFFLPRRVMNSRRSSSIGEEENRDRPTEPRTMMMMGGGDDGIYSRRRI